MPLTSKGNKILSSMRATYGSDKKAKSVFYASINKGKLKGVEGKAEGGAIDRLPADREEVGAKNVEDRRYWPGVGERLLKRTMRNPYARSYMKEDAEGIQHHDAVVPRRKYAMGGGPKIAPQTPAAPWYQRSALRNMSKPKGMLGGASPGRVDNLPIDVKSGSYVVPADVVSGLGQGNSAAGSKLLSKMFSGAKMNSYGGGRFRMPGVSGMRRGQFAEGGSPEGGEEVPIIAASGEHIIEPHEVAWFGGGDMKKGHDALDAFVLAARKKHIQDLRRLKKPKKN